MATNGKTVIIKIKRQDNPSSKPYWEEFELPYRPGMNVTSSLMDIAANPVTRDGKKTTPVTYDSNCLEEVCGSCAMLINGRARMACSALIDNLEQPIRLEPFSKFPVVRDLVTELSEFLAKLKKVKPWLIHPNQPPLAQGEFLQTPAQVDRYKQYSMCINCTLCYAACPVVGLDPIFVGPAALALAQRYNMDSRDQGSDDRIAVLAHPDGIWGCTFVGECTRVCPKHVDPAGAIQQYKLTAVLEWIKSFVMPKGADAK